VTCHEATVSNNRTISDYTKHVNTSKDIDINISAETDCTNIACHSDGNFDGTPVYNNPTWGVAVYDCADCHGDGGTQAYPSYADGGSGTGASNSHNVHVGTNNIDCGECHNDTSTVGTTIDGTDPTQHVNQGVNVVLQDVGASYVGGSETCTTTACHGGTSQAWGTDNTGTDNCTICHGTPTAGADGATIAGANPQLVAPPVDTAGDTLASDGQVGAHQGHMTIPSGYTDELNSTGNCNECHKVPAAVGDADHIDDGSAGSSTEIFVGNTPEKADLDSVVPAYAAGSCTVYCHGASLAEGFDTTPSWSNTAYLSGAPSDNNDGSGDCEKCHGSAPATVAPHTGSMVLSGVGVMDSCNDCHPHFDDGGTLNDNSLHINGTVNIGDNCDDCHANDSSLPAAHSAHVQTAYAGTITGGSYGDIAGPNPWYRWDNTGGTLDVGCGYCHPQSDATHLNGTNNVTLNNNEAGSAGTVREMNGAGAAYAAGVCNQIYCHSDGNDDATPGVYGWAASPDWSAGSVSGACTDCHGNSPTTNSHSKHIVGIHYDTIYTGTSGLASAGTANVDAHGNATYSTTINCSTCHNNTVTTSANDQSTSCNTAACHDSAPRLVGDLAIAGASNVHVNGSVDVALDAISVRSKAQLRDDITTVTELDTNWERTVSGVAYKAAGAFDEAKNALNTATMFDSTTRTCSTIACHNGNSINWGAKAFSCDSCHTDLTN
jgi:predicted CxxxxCH...CXXCH cytochrome family protein